MKHAIASTLSILVFLGAAKISHALSCAPRHFTLSEAYEAADSIIVGLITECKEEISGDPWATGGRDCSFSSMEVLKESIPAREYSGVTSSSGCGLSLHVGDQYLLFLDSKNQPMRFSASLSGDPHQAQLANEYLRIIRDFRSGVVKDLAEPWVFGEFESTCFLSHNVGGNQIRFSRRTVGGPQQPQPDWAEETINGKTVYRAKFPSHSANSRLPAGNVEIVAFGEIPEYSENTLMLSLHFQGASPAPLRQATLSVGSRTWSLNRIEMNLSLQGATAITAVDYRAAGDVAEQILSAMTRPSDILMSAAMVVSEIDSNPPAEVTHPSQGAFMPAPSNDDYFGPGLPETRSTRPAITPSVRAAGSYGARKEPPEPVLRVESRSTQLSSVIHSFRACYAGDEQ